VTPGAKVDRDGIVRRRCEERGGARKKGSETRKKGSETRKKGSETRKKGSGTDGESC
jgi:hypothetical protein